MPPPEDPLARVIYDHDRALLMAAERGGDQTRFLTVLIPYDRTRFFIKNGQPLGFEFELVRAFEQHLNEKRRRGDPLIQAIYVPTRFSRLVPLLAEGIGDIAAGGLTITPEREALVRFSRPYIENVAELVVAHKAAPPLSSLDDLAGKRLVVLRGSSYVESLHALNEDFRERGLTAIEIVEAAPELGSEDLLEMTHAGIIDYTIADRHIAELWAGVLAGIRVHDDLAIAEGGAIAWAIRDGAPSSRPRSTPSWRPSGAAPSSATCSSTATTPATASSRTRSPATASRTSSATASSSSATPRRTTSTGAWSPPWRSRKAGSIPWPGTRAGRGHHAAPADDGGLCRVEDPMPVDANILAGVRYLATCGTTSWDGRSSSTSRPASISCSPPTMPARAGCASSAP